MAAAREVERGEFVLIPGSGFYEFIPMDSEDEETTCTIDQLEAGKSYEIVTVSYTHLDVYKRQGWKRLLYLSPPAGIILRRALRWGPCIIL